MRTMAESTNNRMLNWKNKFLRVKLQFLEIQKKYEISKWISAHPDRAAKVDDIEVLIDTDRFRDIKFKIEMTTRLLDRTGQN